MPITISFTSKELIVTHTSDEYTSGVIQRKTGRPLVTVDRFEIPGPYRDFEDMRRAGRRSGDHLLDPDPTFKLRFAQGVTLGRLFIASRKPFDALPRLYTAHALHNDNGYHSWLSEGQEFRSLQEARRFLTTLERTWLATKADWARRFPTDAQLETALVFHAEGITDLDDLQSVVVHST